MRWIYISPHLDDAVLSAGGLIYEQARSGNPVETWTILAGVPAGTELSTFAQVMHHLWGTSSAEATVQVRRLEDARAAQLLGAQPTHLDFLDCLYRQGNNGEWLYADIYTPPREADLHLPGRVAEVLTARLQPDDVLVAPLALGAHVDHLLIRQAAELLGRPLQYYADIPYLFNHPGSLGLSTAGMKKKTYVVTAAGLNSWLEAVNAYSSQLSTLAENPEQLYAAIRKHCQKEGGISLYQTAA